MSAWTWSTSSSPHKKARAAPRSSPADAATSAYRDVVRLSRLGWSALAAGTAKAVLDYVIPYVNEREAFGEPISNRQAVAFMVATMATEVDSIRLVTLRGAARATPPRRATRYRACGRSP